MNDRIKELLEEQEAKNAALKAKADERRLHAEQKERQKETTIAAWDARSAQLSAAVDRMNQQTSSHGIVFDGVQVPNRQGALRSFLVRVKGREHVHNVVRLTDEGKVFATLDDQTTRNGSVRQTTIDDLSDEFLDVWLTDVLEAHVRPSGKRT